MIRECTMAVCNLDFCPVHAPRPNRVVNPNYGPNNPHPVERVTTQVGLDRGFCGQCSRGFVTLYSPHPHKRRCSCNKAPEKDPGVVVVRSFPKYEPIVQCGTTDTAGIR